MTQHDELERVRGRIGPAVAEFRVRVGTARQFHAQELRDFIADHTGIVHAPNSAYRVMYAMRESGDLDYEVVSRPLSLYRFVEIGTSLYSRVSRDRNAAMTGACGRLRTALANVGERDMRANVVAALELLEGALEPTVERKAA